MLKMIKDKLKFSKLHVSDVTADVNTSSFDLKDTNALALMFSVGAFAFDGSNKIALKVEHSDDDSSFTACDAADLDNPESANVVKTIDTAPEGDATYMAHYRGNKRYVRAVIDVTGTVDVAVSVNAIGGHNEFNPAL